MTDDRGMVSGDFVLFPTSAQDGQIKEGIIELFYILP